MSRLTPFRYYWQPSRPTGRMFPIVPDMDTTLLHELPLAIAERASEHIAVTHGAQTLDYGQLAHAIGTFASGLQNIGLLRGERVAIYLEKRAENVIAAFGATHAGGVFVPINPLLRATQVSHILRDCAVRILITTPERVGIIAEALGECADLKHLVIVGDLTGVPALPGISLHAWESLCTGEQRGTCRAIDSDVAAILYTSGSTGRPKGVVLSHRNMVAGAKSVASYLENTAEDVLLAALPLSFDAGFSQLTTAFHVGARVVLLNYSLPRDLLNTLERERVTGLTAVPPLYVQLASLEWPEAIAARLRYFANTGGRMPLATLQTLRAKLPRSKPYLMYGLTEAFRATYLPPSEIDRRPDSIGKAIPNAEVLVLREDGTPCAANEPGELVQRGALVALGYWNDAGKTAERFRPLPVGAAARDPGLVLPEIAVFSGDTVRQDEEGFLYFVGRRDEMIKSSGYRISPTEVEEAVYATRAVAEVAAFGVAHPAIGEAVVIAVTPAEEVPFDAGMLLAECRQRLPAYMVPKSIRVRSDRLPRNANGKIDRKALAQEFASLFSAEKN